MNKYVTMLKTEIKLSFRGMDMVIFALCLPVVVVVLLGIIYGNQPAFEGASYSSGCHGGSDYYLRRNCSEILQVGIR